MGGGLLGVAALVAALFVINSFMKGDPARMAGVLRTVLGSLGVGAGLPLMLSGRVVPGIVLFAAGAWALGWLSGLQAQNHGRTAGGAENAEPDGDARESRPARLGAMTEKEAYEILGLHPGADAESVRTAHRALIKKLHPDAGGVSSLAARVNEAKDVLLKRHR